jgi:Zn finger protein HypA/HybF involved in hydrogenase expression
MTEQEGNNKEQQEVGLYEKLATRTAELLDEGKKTLDEALKKASEEISAMGDFSREQAEKISVFVRRDIASMGAQAGKTREALKKAVDPQRVVVGVQSVFSRILNSAAGTLGEWAEKSEKQLEYKTGDVTSPGTLSCKDCGAEMHLKTTVRIPPCPKCHKTVFRKSY